LPPSMKITFDFNPPNCSGSWALTEAIKEKVRHVGLPYRTVKLPLGKPPMRESTPLIPNERIILFTLELKP